MPVEKKQTDRLHRAVRKEGGHAATAGSVPAGNTIFPNKVEEVAVVSEL